MIISLSGIDGSGKTTIAKALCDFAAEAGIETIYRHEYNYMCLRIFFKLLGPRNLRKARQGFLEKHVENKNHLYKLWPFLVLMDLLVLYVYYNVFKRRSLVILDRYAYDQLVAFESLGVSNKFVEWLYSHFPRPHVALVLWVDPPTAMQRKIDSHTQALGFYEHGVRRHRELASRLGIPRIKTDGDIAETLLRVLDKLAQNQAFRRLFIRKTTNNRVIYEILDKYRLGKRFPEIEDYYRMKEEKLRRTTEYITQTLREISVEWLLMKTYMPFKYLPTYDIDILVKSQDVDKVVAHLRAKKVRVDTQAEEGKANCYPESLFPISIHSNASWEGIEYLREDTIWRNPRAVEFCGRNVMIPNDEANVLILISHMLFEISYLRLADAWYLNALLQRADHAILLDEVTTMGWKHGYLKIVELITSLDNAQADEQPKRLPCAVPIVTIVQVFWSLLRHKPGWHRIHIYSHELCRFMAWRVGAWFVGRAPFGELFLDLSTGEKLTYE